MMISRRARSWTSGVDDISQTMSFIIWQQAQPGGGYELLFGNLNCHPDIKEKILDRQFQKELEANRLIHRLESGMFIHVDDAMISIGVHYAHQPRLFQLPKPDIGLSSLFRTVPRSTARVALASYIRRHPKEKHRFHLELQKEEESPSGLIAELAQLKKPLKLIRARHSKIYPNCFHWYQYRDI